MDYGKIVSFAFTGWLHDRQALKNALWIFVIALIVAVVLLLVGTAVFGSFEEYADAQLSGSTILDNSAIEGAWLFWLVELVLGVALFFVLSYFSGCIIRQGLLQGNGQAASFGFGKGLRLAVLGIVSFLIALFSWYHKKWLLVLLGFIVGLALLAGGLLGSSIGLVVVGGLLAVLAGMAYAVIVVYNSLRLFVSQARFVEKEESLFSSLRESWNLTNNRVLEILGAGIVVGILLLIVILVLSIPSIALYLATIFSGGFLLPATAVGLFMDSVIRAASVLITSFALVEIYRQIKAEPAPN